jgi:hypothetical protein
MVGWMVGGILVGQYVYCKAIYGAPPARQDRLTLSRALNIAALATSTLKGAVGVVILVVPHAAGVELIVLCACKNRADGLCEFFRRIQRWVRLGWKMWFG